MMFRKRMTLRTLFGFVTLACIVFAGWNYYNKRLRPSIRLDERQMSLDIDRVSCTCLTITADNLNTLTVEMKAQGKPWRQIHHYQFVHHSVDIWIHEAEGADNATLDVLCFGENVLSTVIDKKTPVASHCRSRPLDLSAARKSTIFWHKEWFNESGTLMTLDFRIAP